MFFWRLETGDWRLACERSCFNLSTPGCQAADLGEEAAAFNQRAHRLASIFHGDFYFFDLVIVDIPG